MDKRIELVFGKVEDYDPASRFYRVSTDDGRILHHCRKVGDIVSNTGGRKVAELQPDTAILVALQWDDDYGVDAPEGFILGGLETYGPGGLSTDVKKEPQPVGAQGFQDRHGRRILLHPDGTIEVRSTAWCQFVMDPSDSSVTGFFQKFNLTKDKSNYFKWRFHPESEDLKDAILQLCVSGVDSLSKDIPDVEILAGALFRLKTEDFFHTDEFTIDPGAKVAIRITNPDGLKKTEFFQQVGALANGAVSDMLIKHEGGISIGLKMGDIATGEIVGLVIKRKDGIDAVIKIGDMAEGIISDIRFNNVKIKVLSNGNYAISNDNTEIEATNSGTVNMVCKNSSLGTKNAPGHIALAEQVISIFEQLLSAIGVSMYMATSPGAPTKPGPLNKPQFDLVKARLNTIKSTIHAIDK